MPLKDAVASAPGKLILFGEHAVVYGRKAIAISINNLRIQTSLKVVPNGFVSVYLYGVPDEYNNSDNSLLYRKWNINDLFNLYEIDSSIISNNNTFQSIPFDSILKATTIFLINEMEKTKIILYPLVFLIIGILTLSYNNNNISGFELHIEKGEFPIGAGLGSSAAFCVATATCLLSARNALNDTKLSIEDLDLINQWGFLAETIIHGVSSGIDNTVSTYGGAILFEKELKSNNINKKSFQNIENFPSLQILLSMTNSSRNTKKLVKNVKVLHDTYPFIINKIFDTVNEISNECLRILRMKNPPEIIEKLWDLVRMNQSMLEGLGVGHQKINIIKNIGKKYNFSTKLTGAGGGGCTISISKEFQKELLSQNFKYFKEELLNNGFQSFETALAGDGVKIHV